MYNNHLNYLLIWTAIKMNQKRWKIVQLSTTKESFESNRRGQVLSSLLLQGWPWLRSTIGSTPCWGQGKGSACGMSHRGGSQVTSHLDLWMSYSLLTLRGASNQKDSKQDSAISLGHRKLDKEDNLWNSPLAIDLWEISPQWLRSLWRL